MNLNNFESNVRDIREDDGAERVYVTTLPITQGHADAIIQGIVENKESGIEFVKNDGTKHIIRFKIVGE